MGTVRGEIALRSLALVLERSAMAALVFLGVTFALESIHPVLGLGGIVLTNVEAILFLALALWVAALGTARRRPRVPRTVSGPAVVWLAVLLMSALLAPSHRVQAVKFVGRMTAGVLTGWMAYDLSRTEHRWGILVRALALGGVVVGVLGLAEGMELPLVDGFLAGFKHDQTVVGEVLRVSSTLGYATIASMVLELSVPLLLAWLLTAEGRGSRVLLGAGLTATLAAQGLTLTRGGLIALVVALGFMAAWAVRQGRWGVAVGSLATCAILLTLWGGILIWNPVARYRLRSETEQHWYRAAYQAPPRLTVDIGETVSIPVTVTNTSVRTWRAAGDHAFRMGYRFVHPDGTVSRFEGERVNLPHDVPSQSDVRLEAEVIAPRASGEYTIEWDMVQEEVTWFSWEGTTPGRTSLTVVGVEAGGRTWSDSSPAAGTPSSSWVSQAPTEGGRLWLWQVAARMVAARPLFGVGPDNFRWLHGAYSDTGRADNRIHANNLYVEWLVDTGIVGFAAFLWMTWRLGRAVHSALDEAVRRKRHAVWQAAVTASLIGWFAHGLVDFFYEFTPTYLAFALLCGLALSGSPFTHGGGCVCASDST